MHICGFARDVLNFSIRIDSVGSTLLLAYFLEQFCGKCLLCKVEGEFGLEVVLNDSIVKVCDGGHRNLHLAGEDTLLASFCEVYCLRIDFLLLSSGWQGGDILLNHRDESLFFESSDDDEIEISGIGETLSSYCHNPVIVDAANLV